MAQDKSEQILIRVTPDTKERWEQAYEEMGLRGYTDLVRQSVANEIQGRNRGTGDVEIDPDEIADVVEDVVADQIEPIDDRLGVVESAVQSLRDDVRDTESATVNTELVADVLRQHAETPGASEPLTPAEVADELDVATRPVRISLETLDLKSERIRSAEYDDGETRGYYLDV